MAMMRLDGPGTRRWFACWSFFFQELATSLIPQPNHKKAMAKLGRQPHPPQHPRPQQKHLLLRPACLLGDGHVSREPPTAHCSLSKNTIQFASPKMLRERSSPLVGADGLSQWSRHKTTLCAKDRPPSRATTPAPSLLAGQATAVETDAGEATEAETVGAEPEGLVSLKFPYGPGFITLKETGARFVTSRAKSSQTVG